MSLDRFSVLDVLDIVTKVLLVVSFAVVWRRLDQLERSAASVFESASFERRLLAHVMGVTFPEIGLKVPT